MLAPRLRYRPAFVELAGFGRRSTFYDLHIRVMSVLVDLLQTQVSRLSEQQIASATAGLNSDVVLTIKRLRDPALAPEKRALYRSWLLGTGPTPTQARKEGLSGRLFDWAGATDLVKLWQAIGVLQILSENSTLLLLIDEGEAFQRVVHPDSLSAIAAGLRNLFDASNSSLGCIFALNLPDVRNPDHPFLRSDIVSRLPDRTLKLEALNTPERIKQFFHELWGRLSVLPVPLFDAAALDVLSQRLARFRTLISRGQISQSVTATQRDLVQVMTVIGNMAFQQQVLPPIRVEHLRAWLPGGMDGP